MNVSLKFPEKVRLEINEKPFGWAENIEVVEAKAKYKVEAMGESKPVAVLYGEAEYQIKIIGFSPTSGNSFCNRHNFDLSMTQGAKKTVFVGCEWTQLSKNMKAGSFIAEKIELSASRRWEEAS